MMYRVLLLITISCITGSTMLAQTFYQKPLISEIRPLKLGDKVPDIDLGEVLNHSTLQKARISDFKGKLLILDFWSTYCAVCLKQFPKLEKLQKEFGDRIAILPVGFDATKNGSIREYLEKAKGTDRQINLPTAVQKTSDSILMKLFPFQGLPHEVWIDDQGVVTAITDHLAITKENIQATLDKTGIRMTERKIRKAVSGCIPFLVRPVSNKTNYAYGSVLTGYIDSIANITIFGYQCDSSKIRLFDVNQTVLNYYKDAYSKRDTFAEVFTFGNKRIIVETHGKQFFKDWRDAKNVDNWGMDEFRKKNLFCYEMVLPNTYSMKEAYDYMILDLDRNFQIKSRIEKRNVKCLALIRVKDKNSSLLFDDKSEGRKIEANIVARNSSMSILVDQLNSFLGPIVIDATEYKEKINIAFFLRKDCDLNDARNCLSQYGMDLEWQEKELNMLVLESKQ